MQTENDYRPLEAGEMLITNSSGEDYEILPDGEPLQAHISEVGTVQAPKFDAPDELVDKLVVKVQVDEPDQPSQVYTSWITPSLHEKGKLLPLVKAVLGDTYTIPFDPKSLVGKPIRIILTEPIEKKDRKRQYIRGWLKPKAGQTVPSQDKIVSDDEVDGLLAILNN